MKRKKYIFSLLASICAIGLCSCSSAVMDLESKYPIGYELDSILLEQKSNGTFFQYINYCFWTESGYDICAHFDSISRGIDRIGITNSAVADVIVFESVSKNDDVFHVISLVGIPFSTATSGVCSLSFKLEDAKMGDVYLYEVDSFLYVNEIRIVERSQ
jgi:hypothetical protein